MKKIYALIITLVTVIALSFGGAAQAGDGTPGGISYWEYSNLQRGTMSNVEAWLEVQGAGKVVVYQNGGQNIVKQYPWYGGNHKEDYFQIAYSLNARGQYVSTYITSFNFTYKG